MENIKEYKPLIIPSENAWDKKNYDPIVWLYQIRDYDEWPKLIEQFFFDPYFNIKSWIITTTNSIINLIKWLPIIWKDRNWGGFYIYEILQFKILQQRNYLVKNNRHTNIAQNNRDMTVCLNLIERIKDDWYSMEYLDYQKSEFVFENLSNEETEELEEDDFLTKKEKTGLQKLDIRILEDNTIDYINKYKSDLRRVLKTYPELIDYTQNQENLGKLALYMSIQRQEKAKKLLFKVLSEQIGGWWD